MWTKTKKGYNDIFTLNPNWSECWDYERNNIDPYSIGEKSHLKVHWICSVCGQKFSQILSTTKKKILCSKCKNEGKTIKRLKEIINQDGSLLDNYPQIAKEWNYTKNGDLKPENITSHSPRKVWWNCPNGHQYLTAIRARAIYGYGCKYCAGHGTIKGENDLETDNPKLLKEWDYENNTLAPSEYSAHSKEKVWWKCSKGHKWEAAISNRNHSTNPTGCPYCANQKVWPGYNDLLSSNPTLAKEWNYEKNIELRPEDVIAGSKKIVWWKCSKCEYEWQEQIAKRNARKNLFCNHK